MRVALYPYRTSTKRDMGKHGNKAKRTGGHREPATAGRKPWICAPVLASCAQSRRYSRAGESRHPHRARISDAASRRSGDISIFLRNARQIRSGVPGNPDTYPEHRHATRGSTELLIRTLPGMHMEDTRGASNPAQLSNHRLFSGTRPLPNLPEVRHDFTRPAHVRALRHLCPNA